MKTWYVALLVYRETGEPMPSDVNEVGEDSLDLWTSNWPDSAEQREKAWSSSKSSDRRTLAKLYSF